MNDLIRVILVDDHPLIVDGLTHFLNCEDDIQVIGSCLDGRNALRLIHQHKPDVLVLDLEMPYHGFNVLNDISAQNLGLPVLVFTGFDDDKTLKRVIEHGAAGFISKTQAFAIIPNAIRQLSQGLTIFPRSIPAVQTPAPIPDDMQLSERELEVLEQLSQGLTNSEIARKLNISKNTVGFHLKNIFAKISVNNRTEATVWYFSNTSSFS